MQSSSCSSQKVPENILRCIFALHVQEEICFPFKRCDLGSLVVPAAIVLTHVWRRIALSSPELWNIISLDMDNIECSFLPCALELLSRARGLPMNVKLTAAFHPQCGLSAYFKPQYPEASLAYGNVLSPRDFSKRYVWCWYIRPCSRLGVILPSRLFTSGIQSKQFPKS
jgi:hypothetical protein